MDILLSQGRFRVTEFFPLKSLIKYFDAQFLNNVAKENSLTKCSRFNRICEKRYAKVLKTKLEIYIFTFVDCSPFGAPEQAIKIL